MLENHIVYLSNMKWLVVDEVDTLFETGKLNSIIENIALKTKRMQVEGKKVNILFSGTTHPQ